MPRLQRQPAPAEPPEPESDRDDALCEGVEFPPAAVWFSDPMLARIRANKALMRFGSNGEPVALVQQAVVAWGCNEGLGHLLPKFGVDGLFRSETRAAVKTFQGRQGIKDDGIVGPITMTELDRFIPGELPPCPFGTEPAAFVGESGAEPEETPCLPPGTTPPVPLAGVCQPQCKPEDFNPEPPPSPLPEVGHICRARRCAPAFNVANRLFCLNENDPVEVNKKEPVTLGDGTKDVILHVKVLGGTHQGKDLLIRQKFVQGCAKRCSKSPLNIRAVVSGAFENSLTLDDYYPKGTIADSDRIWKGGSEGTAGPWHNTNLPPQKNPNLNQAAGVNVQIIAQIEKDFCRHELFSLNQFVTVDKHRVAGITQADEGTTKEDITASGLDFSFAPHRQVFDGASVTNISMADFPGERFAVFGGLGGTIVDIEKTFTTSITETISGRTKEVKWQTDVKINQGVVVTNTVKVV